MKKTSQAERIATIYAVWNDFLLNGRETPSDKEILDEVRENWTPNKAHSAIKTWQDSLNKMRAYHIIPHGRGKSTLKMTERGANHA